MSKITIKEKEFLEERLNQLLEQEKRAKASIGESGGRYAYCTGNDGFNDLPNYALFEDNKKLRAEINNLKNTLKDAEIVDASNDDKIDLGSKFVATLNDIDGSIVTNKYILDGGIVQSRVLDSEYRFISINSPFGKAVLSKGVNDSFSYVTPGKIVISGVIDEVIIEKQLEESTDKKLVKTKKN